MTDREVELHERLAMPEALLSRTDLRELGSPRRAVDAIVRELDVVVAVLAASRAGSYLSRVGGGPTYRDDRVRA